MSDPSQITPPSAPAPEPDEQPTAASADGEPSSGILARAQRSTAARVREGGEAWVFGFKDQVAELLAGRVRDVDGYLYNVFRQIAASPQLRDATRDSLAGGILLGATLGFEVGGPLGHYYLTPRWNRNATRIVDGRPQTGAFECVPVIGYRGFFELGYRSGHVAAYEYVRVREGDHFDSGADSDRGQWWEYKPMAGGDPNRPLTHVVAIAKLLSGQRSSLPMTIDEILKRRPTQYERTPWGKDPEQNGGRRGPFFDAMATKTPFREQAKFMRLSTDLALAADADEMISRWNRETQALEREYTDEPERVLDAPSAGIAADRADSGPTTGDQARPDAQAVDGSQAVRSAPTAAVYPGDLPALAAAEGRELTEAEYEAWSAWSVGAQNEA